MEFSLDRLPDLNNLQLPLNTILLVLGAAFVAKWAVTKTLSAAGGAVKKGWTAFTSVLPVNNIKVAGGYGGAILFALGGMTSVGYGISNMRGTPAVPTYSGQSELHKEALAKIKEGADPKGVSTVLISAETAEKRRYEAQKDYFDNQNSASVGPKPLGVPWLTGGIAATIIGIALCVRTAQRDTEGGEVIDTRRR